MEHCYSTESSTCRGTAGNAAIVTSSEAIGWRSLLVQHVRLTAQRDAHETSSSPDQLIVVLKRGAVDIESFNQGRWSKAVYRVGAAGMTAPHEVDRLRWTLRSGCDSFENLYLFLSEALILETAEHFRRPGQRSLGGPFSSLVFRDGTLAQLGDTVLSAVQAGAPDLYAQATAQWLAAHMVCTRLGVSESQDRRRSSGISDTRLARAIEYMSAHLAENISLSALAAEAGASRFHFVRLFRERLGETPIRYLMNLRMDTAVRLLATSDLPIGQIAFECGYPNNTHFSGAFRRRYGCSPEAYRLRL